MQGGSHRLPCPLQLPAVLDVLLIWPVVWVFAEELPYLRYGLPRQDALSGCTTPLFRFLSSLRSDVERSRRNERVVEGKLLPGARVSPVSGNGSTSPLVACR